MYLCIDLGSICCRGREWNKYDRNPVSTRPNHYCCIQKEGRDTSVSPLLFTGELASCDFICLLLTFACLYRAVGPHFLILLDQVPSEKVCRWLGHFQSSHPTPKQSRELWEMVVVSRAELKLKGLQKIFFKKHLNRPSCLISQNSLTGTQVEKSYFLRQTSSLLLNSKFLTPLHSKGPRQCHPHYGITYGKLSSTAEKERQSVCVPAHMDLRKAFHFWNPMTHFYARLSVREKKTLFWSWYIIIVSRKESV